MRAILPGRPQAELQAVATGLWEGHQIIGYVSGNALVILDGANSILQTTYHEHDDDLATIALDEGTGKIATASASAVHIYQPYGKDEGDLKWSLQYSLALDNANDTITTLSWGSSEELLVGGSSLTLYSTRNDWEKIWSKPLANCAKYAQFSHDANLIATTGKYDRLVKIWRRLSAEAHFDYSYLSHPATITGMHWRRPFKGQSVENVLYTICCDNKVRIWVPGDTHGLLVLRLWGQIDLLESIQPRSVLNGNHPQTRYAFIIDSRDFTIATERAVEEAEQVDGDQHALQHLIEVAKRSPEACVVLDERGNMSAWGLENVGSKHRKATDIFNIAHGEGLRIHFAKEPSGLEKNVQFYNFCEPQLGGRFTLLSHHFDGRIEWFEGGLSQLFDPSPITRRLQRKTVWTGHSHPIRKVVRTASGRALVSRTGNSEGIVWAQKDTRNGTTLARHSTIKISEHIHRMWVLREGDYTVFLHHESISLWDTRGPKAVEAARLPYTVKGKALCLLHIPETKEHEGRVHLATISSEMKGVAWEVKLPEVGNDTGAGSAPSIHGFSTFDLGSGDDLAFVLPVDPAGTDTVHPGFLDTFARDVAISYTKSGVIKSWTARVDVAKRKLEWLLTSTVETSVENPFLVSGTSIRKAALVDAEKTSLTIWNTRSAQLEHEEKFDGQGEIGDLDWSSTPDNQSILAVGFPHKVVIYSQLRYDYLDAGPSWAHIKEIRTRDLTPHPIGDSVWLGGGHFAIGTGHQLFVLDNQIDVSDNLIPGLRVPKRQSTSLDIFTVVSRLNGPLPVYHPQLLIQCILSGKIALVHKVLINLYNKMKFFIDGDDLDSFLGLSADDFSSEQDIGVNTARKEMRSYYADFSEAEPDVVNTDVAHSLNGLLTRCQVPLLSSREQFNLADIIECVGVVEQHRRSLDDNGTRFLLFFREHLLRAAQPTRQLNISWREIIWAYHSTSQDVLVDLVSRHTHGRLLWEDAKESGMFMWLTDLTTLRTQFENIARNEYTKTEGKNPVDCSLYYLALKKKAVLVGLWRMATWNRERTQTHKLLQNNFNEPRWRTAALKNAYALLGKHRYEYAAAFFLLAGQLKDAVNVLATQVGDTQLAIAVARVYEGDEGPVLRSFIEDRIIPQAVRDSNRWMASWGFWMLNRKDKAVRALVSPLEQLVSPPQSPNLQSKLFLTDDAALIVLYKQLRDKSLQTLRGAIMVSPKLEWDFVLHTARLYQRMGCDLLALDLVRTWEFLASWQPRPSAHAPANGSPLSPRYPGATTADLRALNIDPRRLLRRRSSLVIADLPSPLQNVSMSQLSLRNGIEEEEAVSDGDSGDGGVRGTRPAPTANGTKEEKKKPTMISEPDPNSLLDSFGF
ncbi:RAVE protein 1 C terminal-domain-containing protein [Lineolata rhizophorae]|uniref:RAVE protein 1 C terminal-domain-containing protein n=1 Tax=Lineolata rhizophorae TaxID=578093 RepID=A0A6A6P4N1_9PEZI|nr:RAVE protein 1 C terminal-domain-containing protein [Lineolata rhizophorae]